MKKSDSLQVYPRKQGRKCVKTGENKVKFVLGKDIKMH
jgi:hypothetical protein